MYEKQKFFPPIFSGQKSFPKTKLDWRKVPFSYSTERLKCNEETLAANKRCLCYVLYILKKCNRKWGKYKNASFVSVSGFQIHNEFCVENSRGPRATIGWRKQYISAAFLKNFGRGKQNKSDIFIQVLEEKGKKRKKKVLENLSVLTFSPNC